MTVDFNGWYRLVAGMMMIGFAACSPSIGQNGCDGSGTCANAVGSKEPINEANNPDIFNPELERHFSKLPTKGEAKRIPWAGSYWPTAEDSINVRWAGSSTMSPTAKYAKAFGVEGLEDTISGGYGIDSQSYNQACKQDSECNETAGEICAIRVGKDAGYCIPTWFGQCHAWTPAAILEPEPIKPVTVNGVTFEVNDIKALMTFVYNNVESRFLSSRCDIDSSSSDMSFDALGRPTSSECRDSNAGTFHIITANYLGIKGLSFVEDRTFDAQVWNQPMRGYQVEQSNNITAQEANEKLGVGSRTEYTLNPAAKKFVYVVTTALYISESAAQTNGNLSSRIDRYTRKDQYTYILELSADDEIIGGEWVGSSMKNHPDFLWLPIQQNGDEVSGISYSKVKDLLNQSVAP